MAMAVDPEVRKRRRESAVAVIRRPRGRRGNRGSWELGVGSWGSADSIGNALFSIGQTHAPNLFPKRWDRCLNMEKGRSMGTPDDRAENPCRRVTIPTKTDSASVMETGGAGRDLLEEIKNRFFYQKALFTKN
jgi:hypothetical protein